MIGTHNNMLPKHETDYLEFGYYCMYVLVMYIYTSTDIQKGHANVIIGPNGLGAIRIRFITIDYIINMKEETRAVTKLGHEDQAE